MKAERLVVTMDLKKVGMKAEMRAEMRAEMKEH